MGDEDLSRYHSKLDSFVLCVCLMKRWLMTKLRVLPTTFVRESHPQTLTPPTAPEIKKSPSANSTTSVVYALGASLAGGSANEMWYLLNVDLASMVKSSRMAFETTAFQSRRVAAPTSLNVGPTEKRLKG